MHRRAGLNPGENPGRFTPLGVALVGTAAGSSDGFNRSPARGPFQIAGIGLWLPTYLVPAREDEQGQHLHQRRVESTGGWRAGWGGHAVGKRDRRRLGFRCQKCDDLRALPPLPHRALHRRPSPAGPSLSALRRRTPCWLSRRVLGYRSPALGPVPGRAAHRACQLQQLRATVPDQDQGPPPSRQCAAGSLLESRLGSPLFVSHSVQVR